MIRKFTLLTAVLLATSTALMAGTSATEKFAQNYTLDVGGTFWIDNPFGSIEVIGVEQPGMSVSLVKTVTAVDGAALKEGREQTQFQIGGDSRNRVIRTTIPAQRTARWKSIVNYTIRVPRTVHVKIDSQVGERIHVQNIAGNLVITNFSAFIQLDAVTGGTQVDTTNGSILLNFPSRLAANTQLRTINGQIEVRVPPESSFDWVADTIRGDFLTTLPVRGRMSGSTFRGSVNASGGPTITTASALGRIFVLRNDTNASDARSVLHPSSPDERVAAPAGVPLLQKVVQTAVVQGDFNYAVAIGSVSVGEVRGNAKIETRAGEVEVGRVTGRCNITSLGGPLNIGDVLGTLVAHTDAGDIFIRAARTGGLISTGGGIIRLFYTGGATTLHSGGGDIIVRQASAPIAAETRSGDIIINVDPGQKRQKVEAKTIQGNVVLNVGPSFGADIDATVLTSDPDHAIRSDFRGLTIEKSQIGGRTRIRATGKINGGGDRVQLYAEEGDIHIASQSVAPITVMAPQ